jgi:hypothetical protein
MNLEKLKGYYPRRRIIDLTKCGFTTDNSYDSHDNLRTKVSDYREMFRLAFNT